VSLEADRTAAFVFGKSENLTVWGSFKMRKAGQISHAHLGHELQAERLWDPLTLMSKKN
jgi:hypothetical protein